MDYQNAIQRWIGVGEALPRTHATGNAHRTTQRILAALLATLMIAVAGPVAAQATTVSITGANRPSFSRIGQPVTFNVQLSTGNTEISDLVFTSGSPTGMSAVSCPSMPADLGDIRNCTFTYTTTANDMALGKVTALGRWRATRPTGASRSGTTNTFELPFAPAREPDPVQIGIATAGDSQATLNFTPGFDGGQPIDSYTVTSSPQGIIATSNGSPVTITGLTNGTAYTFTVTATSIAGTGTPSAASNSVTPKAAQTIAFANPGPQNFGTAPTLTATASSNLPVTFTSGTTGVCTITSGGLLTFSAADTCTINANQAGNAAFNAAAQVSQSFVVNAVVPGAPTIGTAIAGDTQATVGFTPPASNGGATITHYTVTSNPGGLTASGMSAPITVTGLTNGVAYTFTVTADNSAGTGAASAASNSVTPDVPPAITSVAVPANSLYGPGQNLDFTVSWDHAVTITGTPRIALTIGATTVYATYLSSPNQTTTLFRYTVQAGQSDADGITVGALTLNGGTVRSGGMDASLTLNSVGSTSGVLVGVINQAPVNRVPGAQTIVQDVALFLSGPNAISISDADAGGATVRVTLTASNGLITLASTTGLVFMVGSGFSDGTVSFDGRIADINGALNGLLFTPTVGYTGQASLQITSNDLGNTGAGGTKTDTDTLDITVTSPDTTAPTVTSIDRVDASPTHAATLRFLVTFSEPVAGVDVADFTVRTTGTASGLVASIVPSDAQHFTVTVSSVAGDGTLALDLNSIGTAITDTAGNLATGFDAGQAYAIDNAAPSVLSVTVPAAGQYIAGQALTFALVFNEPVFVTGTPNLPLTLDAGVTRQANYVSGSGSNVLVFAYTVAPGDQDLDGIVVGTAFAPNGGTLADALGTAAATALGTIGDTSGVQVGLLPQTITGLAANPVAPAYVSGGTFNVGATGGASGLPVVFASTTPSVCSVSGSTVTMLAAGNCSLTANQAGNANYSAATQVALDVSIGAGAQAITTFAANPAAPVYSPNGTFALSATGGASGNAVVFASTSPAVCTVVGSTVTMLAAGACSLTADQAGNANYTAAPQVALQVAIGRATPTLGWVGDLNRTLGETTFDLSNPTSQSNGTFTFTSSAPSVATVSGRTVTLVGAGVTTLVATQAATGNYASASVSVVLTVTDRPDPTRDPSVVGGLQAQVDASVRFAMAQQSNIQDRLRQQRFGGANRSVNGVNVSLANASGAALTVAAEEVASLDDTRLPNGVGVWTAGTITTGQREPDARSNAFDFSSDGVTVGADWRVNEQWLLGVAGGWGWNSTDLDDARSTLDANQRALSMYGLWRPSQHWFVDGVLGWGDLDFDIRRYSAVADATATAQRSGDQAFGALTAGYEHGGGEGATLTGYGRLDASRTTLDGYREQGLGIHDLTYGSQTVESSGASLGVEGSLPILTARGNLFRPYWMFEYRESLDNRSNVDLNYAVMPVDGGYVVGLRSVGDNALTYGGGIDFELSLGWKLSLLARRQHGDGQSPNSSFGLVLSFSPAGVTNTATQAAVEAITEPDAQQTSY
ncbi:autotransporter domain-containing protein [Lysobacter sp. LF1]|uniref:Autotransporter domain-containing protein n=1 Tax=Lysobacter stagni TaxID=3045172 RepID=A0ABT6XHC9_9GAMM|nr:autotransporter domain-containing protein [Lysobacter sp. LF1]MDI9239560.1 autotransporter domain-containing protein [Lysobacter sp. LF1]